MAGIFTPGEVKVRPGTYFNIQTVGENTIAGAVDGITAVLFRADWGPLNQVVEINSGDGYNNIYGNSMTTDVIAEVFNGGAKTAICCRIGTGGSEASIKLQTTGDSATDAVTITSKYVGERPFGISIRDKLADDTKKECVIYQGTKEYEKVSFLKGGDEVSELVSAFSDSANFSIQRAGSASGVLTDVSQAMFTTGTNPTTTAESYSDGFAMLEAYYWNTIGIDTEDTAVHALLVSFMNRIFEVGQLAMAVVAEKTTVPFEDRMQHAAAYNDEKIHYVVNASGNTLSGKIEGYQLAARVAGMIAACPANKSLTHAIVSGITELTEKLTPSQIIKAEQMGCLVLTTNAHKQVWIDNAINTLITPAENQDTGWKKIRRTKTRYELLYRCNLQAESLIGKVDNDVNGRATIISQIQTVGTKMVEERKLLSCSVNESKDYRSNSDSAWFEIDAIDKDSAEKIYLTFKFRFSTLEE